MPSGCHKWVRESGHKIAKTVLLITHGGDKVIAILPATDEVDMSQVAEALNVKFVELARERDVAQLCPDCELGALPPFGTHYGARNLVDAQIAEQDDMIFEGNDHYEAIKIRYQDFEQLEQPVVARFSTQQGPA